jgi:virulence-associated protein VagC
MVYEMSQKKLPLAYVEQSGALQVIRLPKSVHLNCKKMYVQKDGTNLVIIPAVKASMSKIDKFFASPERCSEDFMKDRDQGEPQFRDLF